MSDGTSLWHNRDFLRLWTGESISQLGTQVTMLALPLVAIVTLNAGTFSVGVLEAAQMLPFLLIGLPAGAWVDRMRRRPVLIVGDLGRAAVLGSIPLAHAAGILTIGQLFVTAFVAGVLTVFFDVAYQSYLPALVGRADLVDGNAKLEISRSSASVAGPSLAGLLVRIVGAPVAIAADAASYVLSAGAISRIVKEETVPVTATRSLRAEMGEGLRYVLRHPQLRLIAACTGTSNLFSAMGMAVYLIFAIRSLGLSPGVIGVILAIGNLGLVLSATLAGRVALRWGPGPTMVFSIGVGSLGGFLVPMAGPGRAVPWLVGAQLMLAVCTPMYNITQVSLRQAITPDGLQGRMNASMRFVVWGTLPIGSVIGGILGGAVGVRPTLWIAAAGGVLAVIPVALPPVWRMRVVPTAAVPVPAAQ